MTTEHFDYGQVTVLPLKVVAKADSLSTIAEVLTPMGKKIIELYEVSRGLFGGSYTTPKSTVRIISELKELEAQSMELLLDRWLDEQVV